MSVPKYLRLPAAIPSRSIFRPPAAGRGGVTRAAAALHTSSPAADRVDEQPDEYQTIGLAIFDGCEMRQVSAFSQTLSRVVQEGGPGIAALRRSRSRSRSVEAAEDGQVVATGRRRVKVLDRGNWFEGGDEAGVIRSTAILRLADASFREYITDQAQRAGIDIKTLHVREQGISIPASPQTPSPKGIIHYTVNGPRLLPIDIHSSLSTSPARTDLVSGEMHIFSGGGKGEYCGSCRVEYALRRVEGDEGIMSPIDAREILEAVNM